MCTNIHKTRSTLHVHSPTQLHEHTHTQSHTHSARRIYQGQHCLSALASKLDRAHISMLCYHHNNSSPVEHGLMERHPCSVPQIRSLTHNTWQDVTVSRHSDPHANILLLFTDWTEWQTYLFSATWRLGCWGLNKTCECITCLPFSWMGDFNRLLWQVLNRELTYFMSFCYLIL